MVTNAPGYGNNDALDHKTVTLLPADHLEPKSAITMASSTAQPQHILIAGGGIAGPVLAFWLRRAGIGCTVVERSPEPRVTGQQVDIRGEALEIVRMMGLEDAVRRATVQEAGMVIVDAAGRHVAEFGAQDCKDGSKTFTADVEILRGELARVFLEATQGDAGGVEYIWGNSIAGITEVDDGVVVRFAKELGEEGGPQERKFDLVVAADGMNSKTRRLAFDDADALKNLGQYMAYFTIAPAPGDTRWASWYNAPGGRLVFVRPDVDRKRAGAYLAICNSDVPQNYLQLGVPEQKAMWDGLFKDAGGQDIERVVRGMHASDDFYMQQIAQVKMPRSSWTKGRVALLGDAGYCPSPITGKGTTLAIIGAYVLAGELKTHGADYAAALAGYERVMRPVVEKGQKIGWGAPQIANPQTQWGISILNGFVGAVSWSGLANWFQGFMLSDKLIDLPQYDM
ncbi:hypothetical protein SLS55_006542 [Diplodia seriata]|uniref:FAD-binding domain-containing protein n=1 Tax=Diplodia seriata TaxID=420778 RepID=A0ABR3CEH0_9PEZI